MKKIFVIFISAAFLFSLGTSVALADVCDCWCGKDKQGARSIGDKEDSECPIACTGEKLNYIICTNDRLAKPPMSTACWTEADCTAVDDEGNPLGVWGKTYGEEVPEDCAKSPAFGHEMRYCYSPPTNIQLGVSIGDVSSVKDLSEYANAIYAWFFYATVIAASVLIIVGGLEYMVLAGVEQTQKAKSRIIQALIGLAILFLIEVILSTINPAISELYVPRVKKVRQVAFVDPETACERLLQHGFMVDYEGTKIQNPPDVSGYGRCGDVSPVVEGADGGISTLEECNWVTCDNALEGCYFGDDRGQPPGCFSCTDIYQGAGSTVPEPSEDVCTEIKYPEVRPGQKTAIYSKCVFTNDAFGTASTQKHKCAQYIVSCNNVSSCRDYDDVLVKAFDGYSEIEAVWDGIAFNRTANWLLNSLCEQDPCKVAPDKKDPDDEQQVCVSKNTWGADIMLGLAPSMDGKKYTPFGPLDMLFLGVQNDCVNNRYEETGCLDENGDLLKVGGVALQATSCLDQEQDRRIL